jgi:presenilin-like A22 family membrane protease
MNNSPQYNKLYYVARIHNITSDILAIIYFLSAVYIVFAEREYPLWLFYFPLIIILEIHILLAVLGIGLCVYSLIKKKNIHLIVALNIFYAAAGCGLFLIALNSFLSR